MAYVYFMCRTYTNTADRDDKISDTFRWASPSDRCYRINFPILLCVFLFAPATEEVRNIFSAVADSFRLA